MTSQELSRILRSLADPVIAAHSQRFFKTGKGDYGEGDQFLGIRVPVLRKQAKKYQAMSLEEIQSLLTSAFHEARLCALLILVGKFSKGSQEERTSIYKLYVDSTPFINNWDLVDSSAHHIVGAHLEDKQRQPLYKLSQSHSLWERRIAIVATLHFIKKNQFHDTLLIAKQLLNDDEDLIHKAVGWMLREVGKRDLPVEEGFLRVHYKKMPRTMLRYAIEKFPEQQRIKYLQGSV